MAHNGSSGWGYLLIWEFRVRDGFQQQFERAYGAKGEWVELFRKDANYIRTDLVRDANRLNRYLTLDYWTSRPAYEEFRRTHADDYRNIDQRCEQMTEEEIALGAFERVGYQTEN